MGDVINKFLCRSASKEKPQELQLYFDTGSPRTFVKQSIALKMEAISKLPQPEEFHGLGNGNFFATHIIRLQIKMLDIWIPHLCFVVPDNVLGMGYDVLVGHDFLQIYDISVQPKRREIIIRKEALKMALQVRIAKGKKLQKTGIM
ncbi:MAG: retropepsin-like aspartic protease [Elusimicrobiota bacterium]